MPNIIIIGAGASGLMAGRTLSAAGYAVTIIEARDRSGGRIHTLNGKLSRGIEEGAEFVHGDQPLTNKLIAEAGTQKLLLSGKRYQVWDGSLDKGDLFDQDWEQLTKKLAELRQDIDLATFLEKHFSGERYLNLRKKVVSFVEGYDAADLHRVSAGALGKEWSETDDEHQYHIRNGYQSMVEFLVVENRRQGAEIVLSSPVSEVQWRRGHAIVRTVAGRTFEGDKVIITCPLGVLKSGMIKFDPSLPEYAKAFDAMGFGGVVKFFFEFDAPFWETRESGRKLDDIAFVFSDADIPTWWSQRPADTTMLTGWVGGPSTFHFPTDREELKAKAIHSLAYILDCKTSEVEKHVRRWHVANWIQDKFSQGAYAYPTIDTSDALKVVGTPVNDTVYFAGEAIYDGPAIGTVEAALVSGRDVGERIAKVFRNQV